MGVTKYTFTIGAVLILIGIAGFVPAFVYAAHLTDPDLIVESGYGRIFGLFSTNILHNLIHLALGIWGVLVAKDVAKSIYFCRFCAVFFAVVAVMGLIPGLNTIFGLVPIYGHNVWLNAIIAGTAAYFGYAPVREQLPEHRELPV